MASGLQFRRGISASRAVCSLFNNRSLLSSRSESLVPVQYHTRTHAAGTVNLLALFHINRYTEAVEVWPFLARLDASLLKSQSALCLSVNATQQHFQMLQVSSEGYIPRPKCSIKGSSTGLAFCLPVLVQDSSSNECLPCAM